jgi:hypothetical protein
MEDAAPYILLFSFSFFFFEGTDYSVPRKAGTVQTLM